jgi:hypothetical protein
MLLLLRLLKALGFDIPARLAELRTRVERRVEQATEDAKEAIAAVVVTAALAIVATITAIAAIAIGFAALYRWVANSYGPFAGLGVVGGILLLITVILGATIWARSQPKRRIPARMPDDLGAPGTHMAGGHISDAFPGTMSSPEAQPAAAASKPFSIAASAPVWIELLPVVVSLLAKSRAGGSLVDAVVASARGARTGETRKAFTGAARIVREGDRLQLAAAAGGAVLVGWLMARRFSRNRRPK